LTVTTVPELATDEGEPFTEIPVMDGAAALVTVKGGLLALPPGALTRIGPFVAPLGTVTSSWLVVADVTLALIPLKLTVSPEGAALKSVPVMVTLAPTGPRTGATPMMDTAAVDWWAIEVMLPAAS
jgi:hypothetical protein